MAICNRCGTHLPDYSNFCLTCGSQDISKNLVNGSQMMNNEYQCNTKGNFGYAVLGFFVPVAGLVLYLLWKDQKPKDAKMAGKGALVSAILEVIFGIIYFILFACLMARL